MSDVRVDDAIKWLRSEDPNVGPRSRKSIDAVLAEIERLCATPTAEGAEPIDWNRVVLVTQGMEAGHPKELTVEVAYEGEWEDAVGHHNIDLNFGFVGDLLAAFHLADEIGCAMLVIPHGSRFRVPENPTVEPVGGPPAPGALSLTEQEARYLAHGRKMVETAQLTKRQMAAFDLDPIGSRRLPPKLAIIDALVEIVDRLLATPERPAASGDAHAVAMTEAFATGVGKGFADLRLRDIAEIIGAVEQRCMAADGPVTPTGDEITEDEIRRIYELATKELPPLRSDVFASTPETEQGE